MKISGRTFIVTGGCTIHLIFTNHRSSGLGLATTRLLSEKGANVAVLDLQEPPQGSSAVKFWKCDVSNDARVESCIKQAIEWSGKESLPIAGAICCAGIGMAGRVVHVFYQG
jgi:NAD(P)-dependent dehydrogenase (short-subunit alcohol dehydrogenase family)